MGITWPRKALFMNCRVVLWCAVMPRQASRPCLMIEGHEDSMGVPGLLMKL